MKKRDFWADDWAAERMQSLLNLKLIIVRHGRALAEGAPNDVHHFRPDGYVFVRAENAHYGLLTPRRRGLFSFGRIPRAIRGHLRNCGPFFQAILEVASAMPQPAAGAGVGRNPPAPKAAPGKRKGRNQRGQETRKPPPGTRHTARRWTRNMRTWSKIRQQSNRTTCGRLRPHATRRLLYHCRTRCL